MSFISDNFKNFKVLSQFFSGQAAATAIATSNSLLYLAARQHQPILHFWALENTVILGHLDAKLSNLTAGLKQLTATGQFPVFRSAGGLGVVSNEGVMNVSFYYPDAGHLSINDAYQSVVDFLNAALRPLELTFTVGEVSHSYCPGTFDLSIQGKKVAGLAQRRARNAVMVSLYISLYGDQQARGQLMYNFYQLSNQPINHKIQFPEVRPDVMANLSKFSKSLVDADKLRLLLLNQLKNDKIRSDIVTLSQLKDTKFDAELVDNQQEISSRLPIIN